MKIALTVWDNRISPVFDVASRIAVYEIADSTVYKELELDFSGVSAFEKVIELAKLNTGTIICGAVSRPVSCLAESYGIEMFSFISGEEDAVITAYSEGRIDDDCFKMPGCRRKKCCKENKCLKEEVGDDNCINCS